MSAMMIAFTGCNQNEPKPNTDQGSSNVDNKIDPDQSTTVTIYESGSGDSCVVAIDSICIYNDKRIRVGTGNYTGDYLVPYNGTIKIAYHGLYNDFFEGYPYWKTFEVGTLQQMYIRLSANWKGDYLVTTAEVTNGKDN